MAHPFQKMFIKAINKSDEMNNMVIDEAVRLIKKGYSRKELHQVLLKLEKSLIEDKEKVLITEAIEELDLANTVDNVD